MLYYNKERRCESAGVFDIRGLMKKDEKKQKKVLTKGDGSGILIKLSASGRASGRRTKKALKS